MANAFGGGEITESGKLHSCRCRPHKPGPAALHTLRPKPSGDPPAPAGVLSAP